MRNFEVLVRKIACNRSDPEPDCQVSHGGTRLTRPAYHPGVKAIHASLRLGAALVAVWLAVCIAGGVFAARDALHPQRRILTANDTLQARALAVRFDANLSDVEIRSGDGIVLRGWSLRPAKTNGNAVILLHGLSDNRAGLLGTAAMLLGRGYEVLLPDARAHGQSGGFVATYGVIEADDLRRWFEFLKQRDKPHCIYGLGDSMGAGELLVALSREPGFCAVIAESPYASFREASYDRIGQYFGVGPWLGRTLLRPVVTAGFLYARVRFAVDLNLASPQNAVASSRVPVLLIHGAADTNLPPRHSELIKAARSSVTLWEPPGVEHCEASTAVAAEYESRVLNWFELHRAIQTR